MTIKDIKDCPNPLLGIYNPPDELKYSEGYRVMPEQPAVPDGYSRLSIVPADLDGINGQWIVDDKPTSLLVEQATEADLIANGTRYALQNQYMTLCGQLTGQNPVKLGFAELQGIIEGMMATDPNTAVALSLKLLTLDAALKREGGLQWWDNCEWRDLP